VYYTDIFPQQIVAKYTLQLLRYQIKSSLCLLNIPSNVTS